MRILMLAAAAVALASPALAQTPEEKAQKVTRAAKQLTGPDVAVIKEGIAALKVGGDCATTFTVGLDGKPKDIKPNCDPAGYDEWVIKAMAPVTYTVELFLGEQFETEGVKQPFRFGGGAGAVQAAKSSEPKRIKELDPREVSRAMDKVDKKGTCAAKITVGVDGKVKNVEPNCDPKAYNNPIKAALEKLQYEPATKDGQPIEVTLDYPLNLGADPKPQ